MFKVLWRRFRVKEFRASVSRLRRTWVVGWNTGGLVASTMVPFSIPQTTSCRMFRVASKKTDCSENLAFADVGAS